MHVEPQAEHRWLQRLVGDWSVEGQCSMGPDQAPSKMTGSEHVRSIGGLWTLGEGRSKMPDGSPATTLMSLGFNPQKGKFVGTFVGSMMTHLWVYEGSLDPGGKVLTLDTEGPNFAAGGGLAKYQDIIEFESDSVRTLKSRIRGGDGNWGPFFMMARYQKA